jgi:hypothetical protein
MVFPGSKGIRVEEVEREGDGSLASREEKSADGTS